MMSQTRAWLNAPFARVDGFLRTSKTSKSMKFYRSPFYTAMCHTRASARAQIYCTKACNMMCAASDRLQLNVSLFVNKSFRRSFDECISSWLLFHILVCLHNRRANVFVRASTRMSSHHCRARTHSFFNQIQKIISFFGRQIKIATVCRINKIIIYSWRAARPICFHLLAVFLWRLHFSTLRHELQVQRPRQHMLAWDSCLRMRGVCALAVRPEVSTRIHKLFILDSLQAAGRQMNIFVCVAFRNEPKHTLKLPVQRSVNRAKLISIECERLSCDGKMLKTISVSNCVEFAFWPRRKWADH